MLTQLGSLWDHKETWNLQFWYLTTICSFQVSNLLEFETWNDNIWIEIASWMMLFAISSNKQSINKVGSVDNKAKLKRSNLDIVYHNSKRYNKNDIKYHMVTFRMAFLMNKWTSMVMDDEWIQWLANILSSLIINLWWNVVMDD